MKMPNSWTELLSQMRFRPAIYLGSISLEAFRSFVQGLNCAKDFYEVPESRRQQFDDFHWKDFETYVNNRHNETHLSLDSFGLAQFEAQGKDLDTFESFKEHPGAWEIWWQWFDDFNRETENPKDLENAE